MSSAAIQTELLSLSAEERVHLIDVLWESSSAPESKSCEAAWAAESEHRIDAYESGSLKAREAKDVFAALKKGLQQ